MQAFLSPFVPEVIRAIGTALAIRAGSSGDSYCGPTLTCAPCPNLVCNGGTVTAPVEGSASTQLTLAAGIIGFLIGFGGTMWVVLYRLPRVSFEPKRSAAKIALERK